MVEQSVERHGKNTIVPPSPITLKEALSIDPRVKYFPSERYNVNKPHYYIKVSINEWLSRELTPSEITSF